MSLSCNALENKLMAMEMAPSHVVTDTTFSQSNPLISSKTTKRLDHQAYENQMVNKKYQVCGRVNNDVLLNTVS